MSSWSKTCDGDIHAGCRRKSCPCPCHIERKGNRGAHQMTARPESRWTSASVKQLVADMKEAGGDWSRDDPNFEKADLISLCNAYLDLLEDRK